MIQNTVGVDVAMDWLDAHRLDDGATKRFANTTAGRRALVAWARKRGPDPHVAFEPSGAYHQALERDLAAVKINPLRARRFAEATGTRAKTDAVDARVLARMAAVLDLAPTPAPRETLFKLKELQIARLGLVKDRTATRNRAKQLTLALLKRQNAARLRQIESQLAALDAEIEARVSAAPDLAARREILVSIPGVSSVTAAALLIDAPELGAIDASQAASLAGVAPITRQSGKSKGAASIRGGRAQLRKALYMPALSAARCNPALKAFFDRLRAAGKPPKVAVTAVMRKLIILANALLKQGRAWTPEHP